MVGVFLNAMPCGFACRLRFSFCFGLSAVRCVWHMTAGKKGLDVYPLHILNEAKYFSWYGCVGML
jgi:hypothetical protein